MKVRSNFVSNSSSSSFIFNFKDTNLFEDLKNYKGLLSSLDYIFFEWDLHDDAKEVYNRLMQNETIRKAQEEQNYNLIRYQGDPNQITVVTSIFSIGDCFTTILDTVKNADTIEFYLSESWDERVTRLIQLLTILDLKGYHSIENPNGEDHVFYKNLEEIEHENQK